MTPLFSALSRSGALSEIDIRFARFIGGIDGRNCDEVFLAAALASRSTADGNICLDLPACAGTILPEMHDQDAALRLPPLAQWLAALSASRTVGGPGEFRPLIRDAENRLYLYRYWHYEHQLAAAILKKAAVDTLDVDVARVRDQLDRIFPKTGRNGTDWQKVAALTAVLKRFCVISGGPGTGKTFLVAGILALLLASSEKRPSIFLAAPTGKAAARLSETIRRIRDTLPCEAPLRDLIPKETHTIHRLLKTIPGSPYFRQHAGNPLPADVVVVDEASMVDLALMSKLFDAVLPDARLILIGDRDQLASVEAGSVLGDICDREHVHAFSASFCRTIAEIGGEAVACGPDRPLSDSGLQDCIVALDRSYRFPESSAIADFGRAVRQGRAADAVRVLKSPGDSSLSWESGSVRDLPERLIQAAAEGYRPYLQAGDPSDALECFSRFMVLCIVRRGPFGVEAVNRRVESRLARLGLITTGRPSTAPIIYAGRPVLIRRNQYDMALYNGDIGIMLSSAAADRPEETAVFFPGPAGGIRRLSPARLPAHETAYAMTVHKSQGSEFDHVMLLLPDRDMPILTRELIYTGITRARKSVMIWGEERMLTAAISRKVERSSGLKDALWEG